MKKFIVDVDLIQGYQYEVKAKDEAEAEEEAIRLAQSEQAENGLVDYPKWEAETEGGENKPFKITSVCKADLEDRFTPKQIALLKDDDMTHIAGKMADAYCNEVFWIDLEIIAGSVIEDREAKAKKES